MNDKALNELKVSLTEAIEGWLENIDQFGLPFVGDNTPSIMADAALAVYRGIADTQEYLEAENMLNE